MLEPPCSQRLRRIWEGDKPFSCKCRMWLNKFIRPVWKLECMDKTARAVLRCSPWLLGGPCERPRVFLIAYCCYSPFPQVCYCPLLTQHIEFRQSLSGSTTNIWHIPLSWICLIALHQQAWYCGTFSPFNNYQVVLNATSLSSSLFVSFMQLTPFELWVKAITHTLWLWSSALESYQ